MPTKKYKAPRAAADPVVVKVRKPRESKPRPPDFTHAEWKADVERMKVVSGEHAKRGVAKKKRDTAVAEEDASHAVMANDRQQPRPPHASHYAQGVWASSQQSVVSPASFSPQVWTYSSSPDYADGDALGGFNPNTAFQARPPPAFAIDPRAPPAFAIDPRGPPPFEPERRHGEVEEVDAPEKEEGGARGAGKRKKRAPAAQKPTEPRLKWTPKEEECFAESWKTVSIDPVTGGNQNSDNYWRRVHTAFEERKLVDPEFAVLFTDRGEKAMANHWAVIQQACNKWHDMQEEVTARPEIGATIERQMVRMFKMYYNDNEEAKFKFLNVFTRIESCEKWIECRQALTKNKEAVYNPHAPVAGAVEGRSIGNKKAKAARDMAPMAEHLQSSIDQCIADAKSHAIVREEKSEARWSALMKKQDDKLDLLRTNVAAKKRINDLAFLMWADTMAMDPLVRACFMAERTFILNQMPAQAANDEDPAATDPAATEDLATYATSTSPTADDLADASPSPTAMADDLTV
ncbi:unnamed protein product [Alopecurus aequalis]